ncbi:hypothetical protein LINPERPRIM_LOCUS37901 [Linum perenne]
MGRINTKQIPKILIFCRSVVDSMGFNFHVGHQSKFYLQVVHIRQSLSA